MQVALLGPLQVTAAGEAVAVGAAKERAVLVVLALRGGRGAGVEELTGALWGDDPPRSAHKTLQKYVSALRRVLPDGVIETVPWGYRLRVAVEDVDVAVFERLVAEGRRASREGDLQGEASCLVEALGLWRGDPLVELADRPVGRSEATRLAELRRSAEEDLAQARLDLGEQAALVGGLESAVAAEPLRERRWAQLMVALYRCGRQAEALRAYQRLRTTLSEELGIDPTADLVALEEAILLQKPELDWQRSPNQPDHAHSNRRPPTASATATARPAPVPLPFAVDPRRLRLVGREDELCQLEDELARACDRQLRAVLIIGEPGVGKTRLATELAGRHAAEVLTLSARAYPLGATASLGLWVEGLERHLRGLELSAVVRLCAGDLDDLAALLPSARAAKGGGDSAEPPRIRLLGALARLLGRLSTEAPAVIVLDDVHLADGSSWEALNYLTRNLVDCRILLLLAARPAELSEDRVANDVLLGLEQEGLLRRLTVTALPADDIRQLAESVIDGPAPDALVMWLMDRARGSPLFAVGLLRALVEESADLEHPTLRAMPEDLAERVEARLTQLDAIARATLELLAVAGYRAELSDLVGLSGKGLDELAPILERLVHTRLVSEIEDGRDLSYEIDHPLIQEAIYRSIGGARRRALHRHAARVLVEAGRLGAAAPHFVRAAEPGDDEAIDALCEALRQAEGRQHHPEALALLDALLELVPAGDRRWQQVLGAMPLQPEWVVDHRADARAETGVRAMRAIEQVLERSSDSSARAAVKFNLGSLLAWAMGEFGEGRRLVGEARTLFEAAGETRRALLSANELGYLAALAGDNAGHEAGARAVLAAGVETGDRLVELQALCSLAWALLTSGRLEPAGRVIERALTVARGGGKAYRTTYLIAQQGWVAALLGRMDEARSMLADAMAGNPAFRDTYVLDFTAVANWLAGDLSGVVSAFRDQLAWTGGLSRRRAIGGALAVIALTELGRHSEAAHVQASVDAAFAGRDWWDASDLPRWSRGVSAGVRGGRGDGLPILRVAVARQTGLGWWKRFALADLAEGAADGLDADAGQDAARLAGSDPWPSDAEAQRALRHFTEGAAALSHRDREAAAGILEPAVEAFAAVGWRLFEGRALALLGHALAFSDRSRAIAAMQAAIERFDSCGAAVRRDWALAALGRLGTKEDQDRHLRT